MAKKVLIVDDRGVNLYMLESLLKGYGFEVTSAENGKDALDKARTNPPDLIVTDILMPVMDGYALCRRWKSDDTLKHIPLVFYTATYTDSEDEEFALSLGADRFIIKPQEPDIFMNMLKEVLDEKYTARHAATKPLGEEMEFFRRHNEILFNKLEEKMSALEIANRKLRISEERYRLSFENASDVIYTIDTDLNMLTMSSSVERILGYKPQEFIGRPVSDLGKILTPESFEQAVADTSMVLEGEIIPASIYRFITKDGTIKYGEVSGAPLMREGKIIGIMSIARDITDRKQVEYAFQETQDLLNEVEGIARIGGWKMDMISLKATWTQGTYDIVEITPGVPIPGPGEHVDYYLPEYRPLVVEAMRALIEDDKPLNFEAQLRTAKGNVKWCRAMARAVREGGKAVEIYGTFQDITEHKKAEEKLKESEKKYRDLYDFLPIPVYEMDLEANITSANRAIYETFRGTEEDLNRGIKAWQLLSPEEIEKYNKNIQRLLKGKPIESTEYTLVRLDGSVFPAIVISSVIYRDGKPVGLRGAITDITERRQQEEEHKKMLLWQQGVNLLQQSLLAPDTLEEKLRAITDNIVSIFDADFSRIWLIQPGDLCEQDCIHADADEEPHVCRYRDRCLHLLASSGRYTHTDGKIHRRVPFGCYKIGRIASDDDHKFLTNDVQNDPRVHNREWARDLGLVSFVGYQLRAIGGKTLGVLALFAKHPISSAEDAILDGLSSAVALVVQREVAEKSLRQTLDSLRKAFGTTVRVMVSAVEVRDPYTAGHQLRSADLARAIATEMGLPQDSIEGIRMAGSIHDIGKLSVPAEILTKPTRLTDIEFSLVKEHSQKGYEILKDVESPWPLAQIVYQHHERMDGSGYPSNLKGDDILMEARIMAVADVVEAMASYRPYRPALGIDAALEEISKNSGGLYDPDVVDACLRLFHEKGYKLK